MPDSRRRRYQVLKLLADDLNLVQREPEYEIPLRADGVEKGLVKIGEQ
jgi:hypothetical protein